MNEKINFQDLSALLAEKAAITKKEAETFLREYFEIMAEELIKSGLLKIKDLGTFKLLPVEDRESIDVTTGEKVLIPAHYKVAFTPDKKLAEVVNEPFAFFETIELDEGFEADDLELISEADELKESEQEFELVPEEEEETTFEEKPPIADIREEIFFEHNPIFEEKKESFFETEPVFEEKTEVYFSEEPVVEEEDLFEEDAYEEGESYFMEESVDEKEREAYFAEDTTLEKEEEVYFVKEPVDEKEEEVYFTNEPVDEEEEEVFIGSEPVVEMGKTFRGREMTLNKYEEEENVAASSDDDEFSSEEQEDRDEKPVDLKAKSLCLNCHDYKAHLTYRKKYYKIRQTLTQLQILIGILAILLAGTFAYLIYQTHHSKKHMSLKTHSPAVVINGSGSEEDVISAPKENVVAVLDDNTIPVSNKDTVSVLNTNAVSAHATDAASAHATDAASAQKKDTVAVKVSTPSTATAAPVKQTEEKTTSTKTSEKAKQVTVTAGQRLTTISLTEYGNKAFWVYIYLENKSKIHNPEVLAVGTKLSIPPASKYSINSNNPNSIQRAKELAASLKRR